MKRINPYRLFVGAMVPNWLLRRTEITMAAKLVYARLCQYHGDNGTAFPMVQTIAGEIGVSKPTAERALAELKEYKLIVAHRRSATSSNNYFFLSHEWMSDPSNFRDGDTSDFGYVRESVEENQLRVPRRARHPSGGLNSKPIKDPPKDKPKDSAQWAYSGPPLSDIALGGAAKTEGQYTAGLQRRTREAGESDCKPLLGEDGEKQ